VPKTPSPNDEKKETQQPKFEHTSKPRRSEVTEKAEHGPKMREIKGSPNQSKGHHEDESQPNPV